MPRIRRAVLTSLVLVLVLSGFTLHFLIVFGQTDTFDSDLQSWQTGPSSSNPPTFEADGGPAGTGDGYMRVPTSGAAGPGGALVIFNSDQWAGDYLAAGVGSISMDVRNLGISDLDLRLLIESGSPKYYSATPVHLPTGGGWTNVVFDLDENSLDENTPSDYATVMADVTQIRLYHATNAEWPAPPVSGVLGVDNITAGAALPVELTTFTAMAIGQSVALRWSTASESNNAGFEVLEQVGDDTPFSKVGYVNAHGSAGDYAFTLTRNVGDFRYRLRQLDYDGTASLSPIVEVSIAPEGISLEAPYPNPATSTATLDLLSPTQQRARVSVTDLLGREVAVAFEGETTGARTRIPIQVSDLATGTYFVQAAIGGQVITRSIVVSR